MRVLFNTLSSYRQRTGVGHYAAHLFAALRDVAGQAITPFPDGWLAPVAGAAVRLMGRGTTVAGSASTSRGTAIAGIKRRLRHHLRPAVRSLCEASFRRVARGSYDLYHEPNFVTWDCDLPAVVTVHDLSVVLHPEWHPRDRVAFHEKRFEQTIARCRHVLTVSEAMRREIIATFDLRPDQVTAVPNGVRSDLFPLNESEAAPTLQKYQLRPGYLLYVGTIEPRKNILKLMQSYVRLDAALRQRCPLVLAGAWGWEFEQERAYFEETARHAGAIHLGYVADEDLPALYSAATALVYPSRYEGFGLPPVEMMACGGAVLASTAAAIREVCGTRAHFVHPDDDDGWIASMRRIISDLDWREELRRGGIEHARRYTWRRCAEQTWASYRSIVAPRLARQAA